MPSGFPSDRTRVHRHPERGVYDRGTVDAILDEALICHLAWVTPDGEPRVIPTIHVRVDDTLYVHGSQASRTLGALRAGAQICIETTIGTYALHAEPFFAETFGYSPGALPRSYEAYRQSLTLPLYSTMSDADVMRVVQAVSAALGR